MHCCVPLRTWWWGSSFLTACPRRHQCGFSQLAGGSACRQVPCLLLFLATSIPPLSLLLPLTYDLKYKLTGVSVVALPRRKKAFGAGGHHQGFCLWGAGCHPLHLFPVTRHQWGQVSACVRDTSSFLQLVFPLFLCIC